MIVDLKKFKTTSYGSARRILCRCDTCGTEKEIIKQSILKQIGGTYTSCARCKAIAQTPLKYGRKLSDDAKRRCGDARRGSTMPEWHRKIISNRHKGPNNNNWNPNREEIRRKEKLRKIYYSLVYRASIKKLKLSTSLETLGYTQDQLLRHIESKFLPGMGWDNRSKWHIDHIKSVDKHLKEGVTDTRIINALSNLQPLWAADNCSKHAR